MTIRGLILITICLAKVLTAQAECCKCDGQQSGLSRSSLLYYLPPVTSHLSAAGQETYQSAGHVEQSVSRKSQDFYNSGYHFGSAAQYSVDEGKGIENSLDLDVGSKVGGGVLSLGLHKAPQLSTFDYKGQLGLGLLSSTISSDKSTQKQVSKVSTHQGSHFINIEQRHDSSDKGPSSGELANSLEHEKGHDHGKNDHYKFEYGVNDQHTHDIKSHKEEKNGDVVKGEYSLLESNGNVRTVKYYADWKTGFHAQIHNSKTSASGL